MCTIRVCGKKEETTVEQQYSYFFVVMMGMGVTFLGLISIIFLTQLMGAVITAIDRRNPRSAAPAAAPAPAAPSVPSVQGDGVSDYVKVAIVAALAQEPGFRMDRVTRIDIKRPV